MKKKLLFFILLALGLQGFSQSSFIQAIDDYRVSYTRGIFPVNEGLIVPGIGFNTAGIAFVRKIDQSGLTEWEWKTSAYGTSIYFGTADEEGNTYLCKYGSISGLVLIQLSPEGDSLWQKALPAIEPYGLKKTHDNNLLLYGKTNSGINLAKMNYYGEIIWSEQINQVISGGQFTGLSHFEMADGKIVTVSQTREVYMNNTSFHFHLFNSGGDSLSLFTYPSLGPNQVIWSAIGLNDNEIMVAGKYSGQYYVDQRFIARINIVSQEIIWQKPILEDVLNAKLLFAGVEDGKVMVSGTIQYSVNSPQKALFMGLTFDGEPLFKRSYGNNVKQEINYACLAEDGGIAAAGFTFLNDSTRAYFIKTDHEGNVNTLGIPKNESQLDLNCYPNPASDFLCINSPAGIRSVELFDMTGHSIQTINYQGDKRINLSLKGVNSGLLTIRVVHDLGISIAKVLVQ